MLVVGVAAAACITTNALGDAASPKIGIYGKPGGKPCFAATYDADKCQGKLSVFERNQVDFVGGLQTGCDPFDLALSTGSGPFKVKNGNFTVKTKGNYAGEGDDIFEARAKINGTFTSPKEVALDYKVTVTKGDAPCGGSAEQPRSVTLDWFAKADNGG